MTNPNMKRITQTFVVTVAGDLKAGAVGSSSGEALRNLVAIAIAAPVAEVAQRFYMPSLENIQITVEPSKEGE